MPTYDFRCAKGHVTEKRAGYDQSAIGCHCGAEARRSPVNRFGVSGFAIPSMRARPVPLSTFTEAQGEMVHTSQRTGVPAPDVMAIAKRQAAQIKRHAPELITGT